VKNNNRKDDSTLNDFVTNDCMEYSIDCSESERQIMGKRRKYIQVQRLDIQKAFRDENAAKENFKVKVNFLII